MFASKITNFSTRRFKYNPNSVLILMIMMILINSGIIRTQVLAQENNETNAQAAAQSEDPDKSPARQTGSEAEVAGDPEEAKPEEIYIGISIDTVPISSNFSGRSIAVFGTVDNADPFARLLDAYAIAVVVRGPDQEVVVRRKEKTLGIWVNRESRTYGDVPSFYAMATNHDLADIASKDVLQEVQLGVDNLTLSNYAGGGSPFVVPEPEFATSLRRIRLQEGLYSENPKGVDFLGSNLFRATLELPSSVPIGKHTVTAYLFRNGELLSSREDSFQVRKVGFEDALYNLAHEYGFWYGVLAVIIALTTGWLASVVFGRR